MFKRIVLSAAAVVGLVALSGCGGGGKASLVPSVEAPTGHAYSNTARARHSYTPFETGSHTHSFRTEVRIGGDLEPRENLRHVATQGDINFYLGAVRDGVGVDRIKNYETDLLTQDGEDPYGLHGDGFAPFLAPPWLYLDSDLLLPENRGILRALYDSVLILNDALPPEFQISVRWGEVARADVGEIVVHLEPQSRIGTICGATAVACAIARHYSSSFSTHSARLYIPDDFDTTQYMFPRSVIVHELLHALGIWGHVDSVEFPDSIMGKSGEHIPNLGHILSRIDREVLQIIYMGQRTDLYNDWDEWSDTSHHFVGRTEDETLHFGVALFNGLPQPWVRGELPETVLADSRRLRGTATWDGALLAFSGPSPLAGGVELEVNMATLADPDSEQDLRFRDIYFINRFESEGPDRWFDTRNIDYKVSIAGNGFQNVREDDYEQGLVTGVFLGPEHEHMGGTVKRTDMVGAFGGSR